MENFLFVICWLGVVLSLLLSIYFLSEATRNPDRLFLGLALLFVATRAAKSTLYSFGDDVSEWVLNIGFAAHAAAGPMLLLYTRSLGKHFEWRQMLGLHFIPAVAILSFSPYLSLDNFWYKGGYTVLLFYTLIYICWYWLDFKKHVKQEGWNKSKGVAILLTAFTFLLLAYFGNYILRINSYILGPTVYSFLIFLMTFLAIRNNSLFTRIKQKYKNLNLSEGKSSERLQRILAVFEQREEHLKPDFSLQRLSGIAKVPGHEISFILNEHLKINFTALTNAYRIAAAEKQLKDPSRSHLSIAGIAYDCGFNSLSSFNTAFKKRNNVTPSDFRKQYSQTVGNRHLMTIPE